MGYRVRAVKRTYIAFDPAFSMGLLAYSGIRAGFEPKVSIL